MQPGARRAAHHVVDQTVAIVVRIELVRRAVVGHGERRAARLLLDRVPAGLSAKPTLSVRTRSDRAANANVTATIDGKAFPMVTEGEAAWLAVEADEPTFVEALKAGSKLTVTGTSLKGNKMTDNYSLSGVTAALGEIAKAPIDFHVWLALVREAIEAEHPALTAGLGQWISMLSTMGI